MTTIRQERDGDHRCVEEIARRAFWNLYAPGCSEHYLVHTLRGHPDFVPGLDLVIERDGKIIGNIMYTQTRLVSEVGEEKGILTFGPVCVEPAFQRMGYGKQLLERSLQLAAGLGYEAVVIFGSPGYYVRRGFQSCKKYRIASTGGVYPAAMMARELVPGVLAGHDWTYYPSSAFDIDEQAALAYDEHFESLERKILPCQEEFYILSNAVIN